MLRCKSHVAVGLLILVLISCTIVKDSDITSLTQLNTLSLRSFEIVHNSQSVDSSLLAAFKYDSVVNRISATGAHVSRVLGFSLPALGKFKMKLKSKTNAATEIAIGYRDNGMPNAVALYQGPTRVLVELYRFYYNSSNQLIKVTTDLNPDTGQPFYLHTRDTIIYPSGNVYPSSIIRHSPDAALAGTFTMQTCQGCSGSSNSPNQLSFQGQSSYQLGFNSGGGNCNSNNYYPYPCGGVNKTNNGSGTNGNQNQLNFVNNFTFNKTIQTSLTSASDKDTYYFHPIMIVKDVIPHGDFYFWFYSVDWFLTTGSPINNSDMVKINFNYGK